MTWRQEYTFPSTTIEEGWPKKGAASLKEKSTFRRPRMVCCGSYLVEARAYRRTTRSDWPFNP